TPGRVRTAGPVLAWPAQLGQPPLAMMPAMFRSAMAAIVNEGLAPPMLPGIVEPSSAYNPRYPRILPYRSVERPSRQPPSGCAVNVYGHSTVTGTAPALACMTLLMKPDADLAAAPAWPPQSERLTFLATGS